MKIEIEISDEDAELLKLHHIDLAEYCKRNIDMGIDGLRTVHEESPESFFGKFFNCGCR